MTRVPSGISSKPTVPSPPQGGRLSMAHVLVVVLSLVMTLAVWKYSVSQIDTRTAARFDAAREAAIGLLKNGMQKYEDGLWAGVSAMRSHGNDMSLEQWRNFSHTLRIDEKYPGINGIGVIHFLTPDTLPAYMADRRAERGAFKMHPPHTEEMRDILMPITFIEPEAINAEAVGLDVSHEVNRRTAALASRDTGTAQITGPITLVQANSPDTPGFLFYVPVYNSEATATLAERQESAIGLVYAPFVVHKLMEGLLAKELRQVRFSITDAGQVIFDEHAADDALRDPDPMYSETVVLNLYGREWVLDFRSDLAFRAANSYTQPTVILIAGLIIEMLIIGILAMMWRSNVRTLEYADRVTSDLRAEKQKLAATNEELEQFAYVASHDLKTPIRGISGLTDMLREDLEDYLASPDAEPEVRQNLDRIDARVARMTELTRGILEFSRVASQDQPNHPLNLAEAIETMAADLSLGPEQISLETKIESVSADTYNLRRVLENLIGNSIKYHDGSKPLKINIKAARIPQRIQFEVSDNGPGIDPQFHQRIFEVFQTLRDANAPESTGIGLAIVKKLVERQGGAISINSSPGHGATFRFDWPAHADDFDKPNVEKAA